MLISLLKFFKKTKKQGWMSLGGILLCITGKKFNSFYHLVSFSKKLFLLFWGRRQICIHLTVFGPHMKWDILILVPKVNVHLFFFLSFDLFLFLCDVCKTTDQLHLQARKQCLPILAISRMLQFRYIWTLEQIEFKSVFCHLVFDNFYGYFIFIPILPSQIAFTFLVYPALILAYMGQAAYLSRHHAIDDQIGYYVSVPGIHLWITGVKM